MSHSFSVEIPTVPLRESLLQSIRIDTELNEEIKKTSSVKEKVSEGTVLSVKSQMLHNKWGEIGQSRFTQRNRSLAVI